MMKGKAGLFLLMTAIIVASCGKTSYKKTPGGMPYKLYASKDTQKVMAGNIIKLTVTQKLNDSVLFTTDNGLPVYLMVGQQAPQPYDISELWTSLKMGDSLVATQMVDTFLKRAPDMAASIWPAMPTPAVLKNGLFGRSTATGRFAGQQSCRPAWRWSFRPAEARASRAA